jgi:subtilisin family serine protease
MDLTTHKLLAAIGLTLAVLFAVLPRSAAAAAPASAPPRSGLQMHWFHSQTGARSSQSRETRFGSKAVIGLESMRNLASLKTTYRFEHVQPVPALHAAVVTVEEEQLHELLAAAPTDPRVRYVSPPGPIRHVANLPSDPLLQSVDPKTRLPFEWQFASSHLERALDLTPGSAKIQVGVIDTGVDVVPDLAGKIDALYDVVLDGAPLSPSASGNDDYGHGTAVASLIAASTGDGFGMAGFGGAAHIVGVHAGSHGGFTDSDVAVALAKLDGLGVRIVNLSLGGSYPSTPILVDAIHKAASDGMLIVAAAGNEGADRVSWPAADLQPGGGVRSYGLAVGATNANGSPASFSNTGSHLSLVAPGNFAGDCSGVLVALPKTNLLSSSCYPQWRGASGATYGYVAGTSFSSPEVAGVAALVWAARPDLKNYQVADILKASAEGDAGAGWTPTTGCGRLDAAAAVELALSRTPAEWATGASAGSASCSATDGAPPTWPTGSQTITFRAIPNRTTADGDFRVDATASSGLPIRYSTFGTCTVDREVVDVHGAGICAITAWQEGNDVFEPAVPVTQVVAVTDAVIPKALPSSGSAGGLVALRYRASAFSIASTSIVVRRNGRAIARVHRGASDFEPGVVYSVPWHAPRGMHGWLRFCVTLQNRTPGAPARSFTNCASLRLKPGGVSRR